MGYISISNNFKATVCGFKALWAIGVVCFCQHLLGLMNVSSSACHLNRIEVIREVLIIERLDNANYFHKIEAVIWEIK